MPVVDPAAPAEREPFDLVLAGGRVVDPETGLDAVRNVGVRGSAIAAVTAADLPGRSRLDVTGRVVSPGFIDLHSHAQTLAGLRLHALDGVTTALELELGALPVAGAYAQAAAAGRPINVGYAASWVVARASLFDGFAGGSALPLADFGALAGLPNWRRPAGTAEVSRVTGLLAEQLAAGALGVGIALGYASATEPGEYRALAELAARSGVPTFTHARSMSIDGPDSSLTAIAEIVAAAETTGAHMHVCHLNSTASRLARPAAELIESGRGRGVRISTEGYPYGSGCTTVGAEFLDPRVLPRMGIDATAIVHIASGRRLTGDAELIALRRDEPSALVIIDRLREDSPGDLDHLLQALTPTDTVVASDAMPPIRADGRPVGDAWPVPPGAASHPRGAGCFARTFRWLVRELGVLSLPEAVRRCTLLPATILQEAAPALARKGRVQAGCDADLVVFDPATISDRATYADPTRPSTGIDQVLVGGTFVVRDGELQPAAMPGRPVYGRHR